MRAPSLQNQRPSLRDAFLAYLAGTETADYLEKRGVRIEIGPDAHSAGGLDNVEIGVGIARKGWLERGDVLNAGTADEVLQFAEARRSGAKVRYGVNRSERGAGSVEGDE